MLFHVVDRYLSVAQGKGFKYLWGLFYSVHMLAILVSLAGEAVLKSQGLSLQRNPTGIAFTSANFNFSRSLYLLVMSIVILPLIEEAIYRLPLAGGRRLKFTGACTIAALLLLVIGWFQPGMGLYLIVAALVSTCYLWNHDLRVTSSRRLTSIDKLYILLLSAIFALDHLGANRQLGFSIQALLAILPFFVSGFMSGLISFRYGVIYTILLHITWNALQVFFSLTAFVAPSFGQWAVLALSGAKVVVAGIAAFLFYKISEEV